ncbi:MAG: BLUF domain-containing protein [Rhodospirillaceae bacterium]
MPLYRLAYASLVNKKLTKTDLREILSKSVNNNGRDNIGGALLFNSGMFLQVLEGSRAALNVTYRRILLDDRHERAELIGLEPVMKRLFKSWSMALIEDNAAAKRTLMKYCGADKPVVDNLSLTEACEMMLEMLGQPKPERSAS